MSKGIVDTIIGVGIAVIGVLALPVVGVITLSELVTAAPMLIASGAGLVISGIGTLVSGTGGQGVVESLSKATAAITPAAPWMVVYGRYRQGGTVITDAVKD